MGFPAARITDMHVCPLVTGIIPHVGGPILPPGGIPTFIGMLPAARMSDMAVCVGPPDVIAKGSFTVIIGKKPAARMLDNCAHGGVIVAGCPTVLIGDSGSSIAGMPVVVNADGTVSIGKAIVINSTDPEYIAHVLADLATIGATPEGQRQLADLDSSGHTITIQPFTPPAGAAANAAATAGTGTFADLQNAHAAGAPVFDGAGNRGNDAAGNQLIGTGNGTDSTVDYNPTDWPDPTTRTQAPGDVLLMHELEHANHNAQGTADMTPRADGFDTNEEFNSIGPENQYRDERGVERRIDHGDL